MLIAHISDPHVTTEGTFIRSVVDTPGRLIAAFETLRDLPRAPDVIVITGDLVNDATPAEYELLVECLGHAPAPIVAIPGNHDHPRRLRTALASINADLAPPPVDDPHESSHFAIDAWPIRLVALDSTRRGLESGEIAADSAAWLDRTLAAAPDQPTIVLTHHTPYPTGAWWFDYQGVRGARLLRDVLARHPQVLRVIAGHVHRATQAQWGQLVLSTAGSTAFLSGTGVGGEGPPLLIDRSAAPTLLWWNDGLLVASEADPPGAAQRMDLRDLAPDWATYEASARANQPIVTDRDTRS